MLPALLAVSAILSACNSKSEPVEEIAVTVSTTAIKNFTLTADKNVLTGLDSVFFSIDLDNGVIFNADSLPAGTNVSRLIPVITFTTTMSKADIVMSGGSEKNDTVNYLTNPTDSIDFTRNVQLDVTSFDGVGKRTYTLKVNVHTQKPDSLMWDRMASSPLPSRLPSPSAQCAATMGNVTFSLIRESDNTLTIARCEDLYEGVWTKSPLDLAFNPNVTSFTATPSALYVLSHNGELYTSADGTAWTTTGETWTSVIGPYRDYVLGVKATNQGLEQAHWPAGGDIADAPLDGRFPLFGRSQLRSMTSKWASAPTAVFAGGVMADGIPTSSTWAYDGYRWIEITDGALPAIYGAAMVRYANYLGTSVTSPGKEYEAFYIIGGTLSDGSLNRTVYISLNNGVNWRAGGTLTDLPANLPSLTGASAEVAETPLTADISDAWTVTGQSRAPWMTRAWILDGYDITWTCPYIYIIGGYMADGSLSESIWRGVLARMAFTPII